MKRTAIILALLLPAVALAEVTPMPGPGDPQVQTVAYSPDRVVRLDTAPGYVLAVEFSPDERIETVAIGSNAGWQVTPNRRANHLFIKQDAGALDTNLTVITDARRYLFTLMPGYGAGAQTPYSIRFSYPGIDTAPEVSVEAAQATYRLSGARALRPLRMSDDGQATSIIWSPELALPAVYAVDASGREMIVNGAMRDGVFVVDAVASKYVFRSGRKRAVATRLPTGDPK